MNRSMENGLKESVQNRGTNRDRPRCPTLDTVVGDFRDDATAEEIVEQYPAISLG